MENKASPDTVTIPPSLLAQVEAIAAEEHRPVAEILQDAVERWLGERSWQVHAEKERQQAGELGLPDDGGQPMSEDYRQSFHEKISQGLQSLREGKGTDGEAFMAEMLAELTELERQGH